MAKKARQIARRFVFDGVKIFGRSRGKLVDGGAACSAAVEAAETVVPAAELEAARRQIRELQRLQEDP